LRSVALRSRRDPHQRSLTAAIPGPMGVEPIGLAPRAESRRPDLADPGARQRDERSRPQVESLAAVALTHDVAETFPGEGRNVGADLVAARADARTHERAQTERAAHGFHRRFGDAFEEAPPAGVHDADAPA